MVTVRHVVGADVQRRMYGGPLGSYIDEYAARIDAEGYCQWTKGLALRITADFSRWLYGRYLTAGDISETQVDRFLSHRRRSNNIQDGHRAALMKMLSLLREKGVVQADDALPARTEREQIEKDFCRYALQYRGLSASTVRYYMPFVGRFLAESFGAKSIQWEALNATHVTAYVRRHASEHSHSLAQMMVKALRTFLRYLHHQGLIKMDLAICVPKVAQWSFVGLPSFLRADEVQLVLSHCDRQTAAGRRDYAIVLLLAHLGLRAGEVAALTLDEIDWEQGSFGVRNKGGQRTRVPLPEEVGQAIVEYLTTARPSCKDRHVFVRCIAPYRGYASTSISAFATQALARAQIGPPRTGAHIFRHALATEMLRQGATLSEIGQLLRHKHPDTTRIYAKVDLPALRELAMQWPGGAR
jgi:site-specific recombinase XerD